MLPSIAENHHALNRTELQILQLSNLMSLGDESRSQAHGDDDQEVKETEE